MNTQELLQMFATKRISPLDGMAVTAEVWEEAHAYHRQCQQLHALLCHGPGIVTGLDVIASDPPDSTVYIRPGVAVDPWGRTITLNEPTAYDLGTAEGWVQLWVSYGESRPRRDLGQDGEEGPLYVYAEFGIEAGLGASEADAVELARVRRPDGSAPLRDAQDPGQPGANEIDMRFRRAVGAPPWQTAAVAVCHAGGEGDGRHAQGASNLARALRRSGDLRVWVDRDVALTPELERYTLVYLVGREAFQLGPEELQALYEYVQGGGTLLLESCRHGGEDGDPVADAAFADALGSLGFALQEMESGHALLAEPFLFAAPPPGFDPGSVQVGEGVIWSRCDYGCLWGGEQRGGTPSREVIRSAMEWGANILTYAVARRQRTGGA